MLSWVDRRPGGRINGVSPADKSAEKAARGGEGPRGGALVPATSPLASAALCPPRIKWFQSLSSQYLPLPVFHIDPMSPPHDSHVDDPRIEAHYKEIGRASCRERV